MVSYYDEDKMELLGLQITQIIKSWPKVEHTISQGCPSFSVLGTRFCMLVTDGIILCNYQDTLRTEIENRFDTKPFDSTDFGTERWIKIDISDIHFTTILPYIEEAYRFTILH